MSGLQVGAVVSITALGFRIPQRDLLLSRGNYCRGRSPPRPSLKTYNTSHRAPKEKRRNAVATLSVLKFNDPSGADRVLLALQGMQERQLITLKDAAVVSWPQDRKKPKTRQLSSMTGGGAAFGALWGFLFGLIFFVPLLGMAIGAGMGALSGSLA